MSDTNHFLGNLAQKQGMEPKGADGNVIFNKQNQQSPNVVNSNGANRLPSNIQNDQNDQPKQASDTIKNRQQSLRSTNIRLADDTACAADIKALCTEDKRRNNFAVLDCLQNQRKSDVGLSTDCQHLVWNYKRNLTKDARFEPAAKQVCDVAFQEHPECNNLQANEGLRISCLIENKENITSPGCRQFLSKMGSIMFSDYRLINNFMDKCTANIDSLTCGRMEFNSAAYHSQGSTIECLEQKIADLDDDCKLQILRVAELQSEDFHLNRPLYYACRNDREAFCKDTKAGDGAVMQCLVKNKFEKAMSVECVAKLTEMQKLMEEDGKINRPLMVACKKEIRANNCLRKKEGVPAKTFEMRQSKIIMCLEEAMEEKSDSVDGRCRSVLRDTRAALMADYQLSPDIVLYCQYEIQEKCSHGMSRGGKTLHCLMNMMRKGLDENPACSKAINDLLVEVKPAEDISLDPTLYKACSSMITKCKDNAKTKSDMLSCLLDHVEDDEMPEECERMVLELQFFISRNIKLDGKLRKACLEDIDNYCSWRISEDSSEYGSELFSCLYTQYKLQAEDSQVQISRECAFEVRRTLRQRAVSVDLNPRIQEPCIVDLSQFCEDKKGNGQELACLQENYDDLEPDCREAMKDFIQEKDKDVLMDKELMKACTAMMKMFCKDLLGETNSKPGDVMVCLIKNKQHGDMNDKCKAGIEHHQLLTLKDYRFSYKFKKACKDDVQNNCQGISKSKAEVVKCLSETIRNDILSSQHPSRVSVECKEQVTFELLQRSEDIKLDPLLQDACYSDIEQYCGTLNAGGGAVLLCLQKHASQLSQQCQEKVLKREEVEVNNVKTDFPLFSRCKRMIKTHCADVKPVDIFTCLIEHKKDDDFEEGCKKMVIQRMRERSKDIRLNPKVQSACDADIKKLCNPDMHTQSSSTIFQATILTCLRVAFSNKKLTAACEAVIASKVKQSSLDYKQNPVLAAACHDEITKYCQSAVNSQDLDDHGQVEECLKDNMRKGSVTNEKCVKQIIQVIKENKVDVHSDPLLYRACALDIKQVCEGVPKGQGRQMSCLLAALDDKKRPLSKPCRDMMAVRRELWEHAAVVAPAEDFNELLQQMTISSSRNYFFGVMLTFLSVIFFGGLCCGRFSRRIRRDMKSL